MKNRADHAYKASKDKYTIKRVSVTKLVYVKD